MISSLQSAMLVRDSAAAANILHRSAGSAFDPSGETPGFPDGLLSPDSLSKEKGGFVFQIYFHDSLHLRLLKQKVILCGETFSLLHFPPAIRSGKITKM